MKEHHDESADRAIEGWSGSSKRRPLGAGRKRWKAGMPRAEQRRHPHVLAALRGPMGDRLLVIVCKGSPLMVVMTDGRVVHNGMPDESSAALVGVQFSYAFTGSHLPETIRVFDAAGSLPPPRSGLTHAVMVGCSECKTHAVYAEKVRLAINDGRRKVDVQRVGPDMPPGW